MSRTDDPIYDANCAQEDNRIRIGVCEECGQDVYKFDEIQWEDDAPFMIERMYFHERCIMPYARSHWRIN